VISYYPKCLCPSRQAITVVETAILEIKSNIENKSNLPFSSRTLWRWRKHWKSLAGSFTPEAIQFLLRDKPDMSIYQPELHRSTAWTYLVALFKEAYPTSSMTILMRLLTQFNRQHTRSKFPPQ
jgi:hypothetical protein